MDEKVLDMLSQLLDGQKNTSKQIEDINSRLNRIEIKLNAVDSQTAELTEFRTETIDKLNGIA